MSDEGVGERGPGRPRSEEKRAAILEAAGDLFLAHGPAGTSMDAVAERAGVSKQTVYSHFGHKEALFEACIAGKVGLYRVGDIPDLAALDPREGLTELAGRLLELLMDEQVIAMFRVVIGTSATHPEIGALFHRNGPQRVIDALAGVLEHYASRGRIRVEDAPEAAALFIDMLAGHLHTRMLMGVGKPLVRAARRRHIERTVRRFMRLFEPG
jgi:TetR/AcrR family transcriptional repressor of mexJK operon